MNEVDAMRRLAAANPVPQPLPPGSSQAQFCLRTVLAAEPPRRSSRRLVPAAAALVLIAGAVTYAVRPSPPPPPAPSIAAPSDVFFAAANMAGRGADQGQFMHVTGTTARVVHVDSAGGYDVIRVDSVEAVQPADGHPGEGWLTLGDQGFSVRPVSARDATAYRRDGSPEVPRFKDLAPDLAEEPEFGGDVSGLPDDPPAAAAAMIDGVTPGPADAQGWLFRECTRLLEPFTTSLSGADRAKVFRTLAGVTGVRTLADATDPTGRPAVGLAYTGETVRYGLVDWQIFLLAGTDRIGFTQAVVRRPGPANRTLAPGTVQYSTAVTDLRRTGTP
ncbi:hypothetical protein [Actinoplanes sp. NBRC 103695]|uniref:hypothetical protein n=1 Tax=Actinoplanes sp. NBRC 103695 TaxID=3032202 RepID=UPI0024A40835|nr:hypothetical protein [Actinoplanes sp. NBRC 103695]GLY98637.1 hypothetical protein Acsp02_58910 [Actinoplanes sp. NBRC 103695]